MAKIYNDFQPANLMSFAKSFARLNGQPLDKSEIWYSLEEAQAYATTEAAYVGQMLAVIDTANSKVTFYGITDAAGTLTPVGSADVEALSKTVEELNKTLNDENGLVTQVDKIAEAIGSEKDEEAGIEASGIYAKLDNVNSKLDEKANTADVYSKEDTDLAISKAIANLEHLTRKIVGSIDDIQTDIDNDLANISRIIYLVPALEGLSQDLYDEYMVIEGAIEKMGSWEVNLENYVTEDALAEELTAFATKTELTTGLSGKVDAVEGKGLSTNDFTAELKTKLDNIEDGAEKNVVQTVSGDFTLENRHLSLNNLSISKVTGLQDELNKKIDSKAGYGLLSEEDQLKLNKLVIGDDGELGVSGSINADNVVGLESWLNKNAGTLKGLSENNLTDDMADKLEQLLFISAVDTSQLRVTSGKLEIIEVDSSKIGGLEEALNNKVSNATADLVNQIDNIADALGNYVLKTTYDTEIAEIRDILTWKEIIR